MPHAFEYAIVRVVPNIERQEWINVGVIVCCRALDFLQTRIAFDEERARALWPALDVELVRDHLEVIPRICAADASAGAIARLDLVERFRWLVAPRNTMVQTSPAHAGLCDQPELWLERLLQRMVLIPRP